MGVPVIPAKPLHISLFITELCHAALRKGTGISSIEGLFYSIRWAHKLAGIECCPTDHPLVQSSLEGARRKLGRPFKPKEPLPIDLLQVNTEHYSSSESLAHVRFLFILLVGFAGFFRIDELLSMKLGDITLFTDRMSIFVPKRKNDQIREGHTSIIARSGNLTCPVAVTERLVSFLPEPKNPHFPLIRRIVKSKSGERFHGSIGISYSTILLEFKKLVGPFVDDISIFGTHSIKSGAASHPACRAINETLLDKHAGWKCPKTKKRYVKHVAEDLLNVTKIMRL